MNTHQVTRGECTTEGRHDWDLPDTGSKAGYIDMGHRLPKENRKYETIHIDAD